MKQHSTLLAVAVLLSWACVARGIYDFVPFRTTGYGPTQELAATHALKKCTDRGYLAHGCRVLYCGTL